MRGMKYHPQLCDHAVVQLMVKKGVLLQWTGLTNGICPHPAAMGVYFETTMQSKGSPVFQYTSDPFEYALDELDADGTDDDDPLTGDGEECVFVMYLRGTDDDDGLEWCVAKYTDGDDGEDKNDGEEEEQEEVFIEPDRDTALLRMPKLAAHPVQFQPHGNLRPPERFQLSAQPPHGARVGGTQAEKDGFRVHGHNPPDVQQISGGYHCAPGFDSEIDDSLDPGEEEGLYVWEARNFTQPKAAESGARAEGTARHSGKTARASALPSVAAPVQSSSHNEVRHSLNPMYEAGAGNAKKDKPRGSGGARSSKSGSKRSTGSERVLVASWTAMPVGGLKVRGLMDLPDCPPMECQRALVRCLRDYHTARAVWAFFIQPRCLLVEGSAESGNDNPELAWQLNPYSLAGGREGLDVLLALGQSMVGKDASMDPKNNADIAAIKQQRRKAEEKREHRESDLGEEEGAVAAGSTKPKRPSRSVAESADKSRLRAASASHAAVARKKSMQRVVGGSGIDGAYRRNEYMRTPQSLQVRTDLTVTVGGTYLHFVDPLLPVGQPSLEFATEEIIAKAVAYETLKLSYFTPEEGGDGGASEGGNRTRAMSTRKMTTTLDESADDPDRFLLVSQRQKAVVAKQLEWASLEATVNIICEYYNMEVSEAEPMIDPWKFTLHALKLPQSMVSDDGIARVWITAEEAVNINLTPAAVQTLNKIKDVLGEFKEQKERKMGGGSSNMAEASMVAKAAVKFKQGLGPHGVDLSKLKDTAVEASMKLAEAQGAEEKEDGEEDENDTGTWRYVDMESAAESPHGHTEELGGLFWLRNLTGEPLAYWIAVQQGEANLETDVMEYTTHKVQVGAGECALCVGEEVQEREEGENAGFGYQMLGETYKVKELQEVFNTVDEDGGGTLDEEELYEMFTLLTTAGSDDEGDEGDEGEVGDTERKNTIPQRRSTGGRQRVSTSRQRTRSALEQSQRDAEEQKRKEWVKRLVDLADEDGSGDISFQELRSALNKAQRDAYLNLLFLEFMGPLSDNTKADVAYEPSRVCGVSLQEMGSRAVVMGQMSPLKEGGAQLFGQGKTDQVRLDQRD
jgi:Ca2+-binding EF-hand superfamily protein